MSRLAVAEYIWIDGSTVPNLRSKLKVLTLPEDTLRHMINEEENWGRWISQWSFDGSSTGQSSGQQSDLILNPVCIIPNNDYDIVSIYVLCEVLNQDGSPHKSNMRARLSEVAQKNDHHNMIMAIEQEYFLWDHKKDHPYLWPDSGMPDPQGKYYCGVGADVSWGKNIAKKHMKKCLECGLAIGGLNGEVAPSQWEFQIGPLLAPYIADQLWLARFLLNEIAAKYNVTVKLHPKLIKGDWNGSGAHINFSTTNTMLRCNSDDVELIAENMKRRHTQDLKEYGWDNHERLTGLHETCHIDEFRWGKTDRTSSLRVPLSTIHKNKGHLEDRRPASNLDPYRACYALMETVCMAERGELQQC